MKQKISYFLMTALSLALLSSQAQASAPTTMALTNTSGDAVQVEITGDSNSTIRLSFLPAGASTVSTIILGTTNSSGQFTTSISSGGYGIPAGSPAYATINGVQSSMILWPSYTSSITLSQANTQIAVGQSVTVNSSNTLILSSNNLIASIGTVLSGSQVTITGLSAGTGTLILCGANAGCGSIAVVVGTITGQTQITLSKYTTTLNYMASENITIFGNSTNGYVVSSNSNSSSVYANISGTTDTISIFGSNPGTATIKICAAGSETNCSNLYVTVSSATANNLSFSQNNLNLIPGLSQGVTVSGDTNNNYYISSNTNSAVAAATVSGSTITVVGGNTTGSTVITVCSASVNNTCSNLQISCNANTTTPSSTVLAFSQNVVSVHKESTTNVTVSGGDGSGYSISSNSNPSTATASITGGSNIISIYGNNEGSSIVEVCSANTVCASIYVTVNAALVPITFSQNNVSLTPNQTLTVIITGGTDNNVIYSIGNTNIVSANMNNNGKAMVLTGGNTSGTSIIKVCEDSTTSNCSDLSVQLTVPVSPATTEDTTNTNTEDTTSNTTTSAATQLEKILSEASTIFSDNINAILSAINAIRDENKENTNGNKYIVSLKAKVKNYSESATNQLKFFITYGTELTKSLGEGERAGVISSYQKAFGKLPQTESEWQDAIKIANGRWPSEASQTALDAAKAEFQKVYKRAANMAQANDNAAVSIIAYGLRPTARNLNSEKTAIKSFRAIYGHDPVSALAWDIVRAIAYSGATR
jgi:hypothetical protein